MTNGGQIYYNILLVNQKDNKMIIKYESVSSFKKKEHLLLHPDTIALVAVEYSLDYILVTRVVVINSSFHVIGHPIPKDAITKPSDLIPYHKNRDLLPTDIKVTFKSVLPITFYNILRGKYVYPISTT